MFLRISWRCVVKVVTDMSTMSSTVTTLVVTSGACTNVDDSCAPRKVDCSAWCATGCVIGPMGCLEPSAMPESPLSTRNRPKKNGDCSRIGMHELNGLVPVLLYRSIVSEVIAWRDSGSVLPLYL